MNTTTITLPGRPGKPADPDLQADLGAFLELRRELTARGAIVPEPVDLGSIIARMTSTEIAEMLFDALGRRKALWVRTRLSQKAEREDGVRQGRRGRDRV